jgi:hypothetical protein
VCGSELQKVQKKDIHTQLQKDCEEKKRTRERSEVREMRRRERGEEMRKEGDKKQRKITK